MLPFCGSSNNSIVLLVLRFTFSLLHPHGMEESADAKEDENKKILHTYPLVRVCDMSDEMKTETVEVIITACEKFGTDYYAAAKTIKHMLDKKYGPPWNVIVGEAYGIEVTHQTGTLMFMFFGGNLGVCAWKS